MSRFTSIRSMFRPVLLTFCLGLLLSTPKAFAAENMQKIGVVDYPRIFQMMPDTKAAEETLQTMKKQTESELAPLQAKLQKAIQAYQKGGKPNPAKEKQLRAEDESFRKTVMEKQSILSRTEQELITPIRQKIDAAVAAIAKKEGYSLIFDKNIRVYGDEQSDITYKVLDQLNIK